MTLISILALAALPLLTFAQDVTVPNDCIDGYEAGTDEVLLTVPYTYDQVMSIIGSYKNLTWSGNPDDTVTLNGTDNTVGTARTYDLAGAHVIETILEYSKPAAPGPYNEVHNTANLSVPMYNVSLYIPYDGTVVSSVCDGKASMFNFTAHFCGTNATTVGGLLHVLHSTDAMTVGTFLGGENFTSCDAIGAGGGASSSAGSSGGGGMESGMVGTTPTASANPSGYTGAAAERIGWSVVSLMVGVVGAVLQL